MLGGAAADVVERHDRVARAAAASGAGAAAGAAGGGSRSGRRRGRAGAGPRARRLEHVAAGDAATVAGAPDLRRVEAVLRDELAHERRRDDPCRLGRGGAGGRGAGAERAPARGSGGAGRSGRAAAGRGAGAGAGSRRGAGRGRAAGAVGAGASGAGRRSRRPRRGRGGGAAAGTVADDGQAHADRDRLALGHEDLAHDARRRRGHLGVDLVGRDLEERFVGLDGLADLLEPLRDGSLGDGLTELRHRHVHDFLRVSERCRETLTRAGCGR